MPYSRPWAKGIKGARACTGSFSVQSARLCGVFSARMAARAERIDSIVWRRSRAVNSRRANRALGRLMSHGVAGMVGAR